jgi:sulfur carrier protein
MNYPLKRVGWSIQASEVRRLKVMVNDELREVPAGCSLQELIAHLLLPGERLAIELNRSVIRRVEWPVTKLQENDLIEIVHFVGGG